MLKESSLHSLAVVRKSRSPALTWHDYKQFFETLAEDFLRSPNYWKIDGRPVCSFLNLADFVGKYGRVVFSIMIRYGCKLVEHRTGMTPYVLGIIGRADTYNLRLANALPLDGITGYGLLPTWLGTPIQEYEQLIEQRVLEWEQLQRRLYIPFFPVASAGWDATVRGIFKGKLRAVDGYPYSPIVRGVTPELFGRFLDHAISFNHRWQPRENIVFLHAWNEWTEASVLEPSDRFGSLFLEEIHKRKSGLCACYLPRE
jgi:hypothetical protein